MEDESQLEKITRIDDVAIWCITRCQSWPFDLLTTNHVRLLIKRGD